MNDFFGPEEMERQNKGTALLLAKLHAPIVVCQPPKTKETNADRERMAKTQAKRKRKAGKRSADAVNGVQN